MPISDETRARIEKGVALLDEKRPGWRDAIKPGELSMRSTTFCIIGQLGEAGMLEGLGYLRRLRSLGLDPSVDEEQEYGFDLFTMDDGNEVKYDELDEGWLAEVQGEGDDA